MIKRKKYLSKTTKINFYNFIFVQCLFFSRENIRQIRVIFVHLHALDHALELTNQYEIK